MPAIAFGGRILAIVVMLLGIGFMAILTANIVARFVKGDQGTGGDFINKEITALRRTALRMLLGKDVATTQEGE